MLLSEFFTCYNYLLKSESLSDEEHDARHDLLVYIQTKLDDYQWPTVKAFHDQVLILDIIEKKNLQNFTKFPRYRVNDIDFGVYIHE